MYYKIIQCYNVLQNNNVLQNTLYHQYIFCKYAWHTVHFWPSLDFIGYALVNIPTYESAVTMSDHAEM